MFKDDILNIFKNCFFENLNDKNFKENILDNLPSDFNYEYHYGASKLVIIPKYENKYVIKIPFSGYFDYVYDEFYFFSNANEDEDKCWDYCLTELLIYRRAKKEKINQIFAKSRLIGTINDYPIYIQEKAKTYDEILKQNNKKRKNSKESSIKTLNLCFEKGYKMFNIDWITDVYNYYGNKNFDKIMNFIAPIGDLHDGNIGYIGLKPIIFDYSDFCS